MSDRRIIVKMAELAVGQGDERPPTLGDHVGTLAGRPAEHVVGRAGPALQLPPPAVDALEIRDARRAVPEPVADAAEEREHG